MINIMKNVSKILLKRKGFFISSIVLPLVLVLFFSVLNSGSSTYGVAIINNDKGELGEVIEKRLQDMDVVKVTKLEDDTRYKEKLIFHRFEMVITINEDFTDSIINGDVSKINIKTISSTDMEPTITNIINNEVKGIATICSNVSVKDVGLSQVLKIFNESKPSYEVETFEKKNVSILASLGIICYLIFVVAGNSCSFLLEDEREGTKMRVLMGNISENKYFGGLSIVFFMLTAIPAIEYFLVGYFLKYEFGFENKILLLLLILVFVLFAVMFSIMITALIKKKTVVSLVTSTFSVVMFMLSGAFWPFESMSTGMQKVGAIFPPRWIYVAIEKLQRGADFKGILPIIVTFMVLNIFLFLLCIFFTRNKIVLVKEK